jgi:hypothetical protein
VDIVAKKALAMVSGSLSDERAFSAMKFIKNDLLYGLDTNLEACLLCTSSHCSPLPHFLMNSCSRGSRACKLPTGHSKPLKKV